MVGLPLIVALWDTNSSPIMASLWARPPPKAPVPAMVCGPRPRPLVPCKLAPSFPTPTNGTLSYTNPDNTTHVGAEATFTCEDGYHLEAGDQSPSNWTIQCDGTTDGNDGQWSGAVATCEPNVCGTLNLVDNGTWDCDLGENIFGETCNIVCDPGYEQVAKSFALLCL